MTQAPSRCVVCGDRPEPRLDLRAYRVLRSPGCGLEWRDPFPDESELAALYDSGYFARWGIDGPEALAPVRAMKQASFRHFLSHLPRQARRGRLLDVGCALGFGLRAAGEAGFDAWGIDVSAEAIERARQEFGERVAVGALGPDVLPGLRFDVITLIDVLEHLPDPAVLLAAARGRLAPDGRILAVLPNAASAMRWLLGRRWPHYVPEHLFHWTPGSLRRFLASSGWRVVELRTGIRKVFTARYLVAYRRHQGRWIPPGLGLLGDRVLRVPTGEMLLVATPGGGGA